MPLYIANYLEQSQSQMITIVNYIVRGIVNNLVRGDEREVWGRKTPTGSRGKDPLEIWGKVPRSWRQIWM